VVCPRALGCGVRSGAEAGEGVEVVGEVGLVVVATSQGEFGPADVDAAMHMLDGLLEALDTAVELGGDADLFAEELGESAGADSHVAGEFGDGKAAGRTMEVGEGVVDGGASEGNSAFAETMAEREVEEVEFAGGGRGFAEVVAEVGCGSAPDVFEGGFAVGEGVGAVGEEGQGAAGVEEDADELGEVDGVDLLVVGVDAEKDGGGGGFERIRGMVGVGEVVAGEADDDLGAAGGEDAFVAMCGLRVACVPECLDEGGESGMGRTLKIKHASTSWERPSDMVERWGHSM
jgi:hypothetical protein